MQFVQAGFLTALAAVAVPIIIHLVFGRRARRVDLGTLRFLRIAISRNMRRKRLKRWLLLTLRMAAAALLAVLFARPFLPALGRPGEDRLVVVLVDCSASMTFQGPRGRAVDAATAEARRMIDACGDGAEVRLAFFDHAMRPVKVGPDSWEAPQACCSTTDYGAAVNWARDVCLQSSRTHKEVHLLTDLQRSGLGRTPAEPLPPDVRMHVVDMGAPYARNAAVTRVTPSRLVIRPGEQTRVEITVLNAGQFAIEKLPVVLHLEHAGRQRNWRSEADLEPGASNAVAFELPDLDEGVWQGYAMVEIDDELPFDDRRPLAIAVQPPLDVLLVDGASSDTPVASETYFLEAALRLAPPGEEYPDSPYLPRRAAALPGEKLPAFDRPAAVVLANVASLDEPDAHRLAAFVDSGGGLMVFPGDRGGSGVLDALAAAGLAVGKCGEARQADPLPWRLETWDRDHPVFTPFSDPQYGDLRRLMFHTIAAITPASGAKVLATFNDGSPALVEGPRGRGKVLWFASACDRDWSDWPRSRLYVPVMHQLLAYLTGLSEGGPIRIRSTDPSGPLVPPLEPGVYDRGDYCEVVAIDPRESETDRSSIADLATQLQFSLAEADAEATTAAVAGIASRQLRRDEIWHWVLIALIGVLMLEGLVANRTTA